MENGKTFMLNFTKEQKSTATIQLQNLKTHILLQHKKAESYISPNKDAELVLKLFILVKREK